MQNKIMKLKNEGKICIIEEMDQLQVKKLGHKLFFAQPTTESEGDE